MRLIDAPWEQIFKRYRLDNYDFHKEPCLITADQIKEATRSFKETGQREVRILCKQDAREDRPKVFIERDLFILPVKNGEYVILKGEGYVDISPPPSSEPYISNLDFELETAKVGDSEVQHLDYAYATSLIRHFTEEPTLILTIRGRKYTPEFSFYVGSYGRPIVVRSVQTEVDAGYEGKNKVVLVEAKNREMSNVIIRQLYYPFRQWSHYTKKPVEVVLFEKREDRYNLWLYTFEHKEHYNSIKLLKSASYLIEHVRK
ncbi:MAG: hypothetical protein RMK19_09185 [Bacteroidia bacterium]|nr:hypothetical protein [Bacteroidia bacterium]